MSVTGRRSVCILESDRLLVFGQAAQAVVRAADGRRLPAELIAAIAELDRLGDQLHIGAAVLVVAVAAELDPDDAAPGEPSS